MKVNGNRFLPEIPHIRFQQDQRMIAIHRDDKFQAVQLQYHLVNN